MDSFFNSGISHDGVIQKFKSDNEHLQQAFNIIYFDEQCSPELREMYLRYLARRKYQVDELEAQGEDHANAERCTLQSKTT